MFIEYLAYVRHGVECCIYHNDQGSWNICPHGYYPRLCVSVLDIFAFVKLKVCCTQVYLYTYQFSSVQFSHSVVSDSF